MGCLISCAQGERVRVRSSHHHNLFVFVWVSISGHGFRYISMVPLKRMESESSQEKPHLKPMLRHIQRSNAGKPVIRSCIEHVFADQKAQTGLFIRTMGITRATMRIGLANIIYNMHRFLFLERIRVAS